MAIVRPEFSRPVTLDAIDPASGVRLTVDADADERAALAERFGVLGVGRLSAEISLMPEEGGRLVRLTGTLAADVVQSCVVTLEPLELALAGTIERLYDATGVLGTDGVEDIDFDAADPPDPVAEGAIDVGEAVAEQLALEIDPFPRTPGATIADHPAAARDGDDEAGESGPGGPFAALAKLKRKPK